MTGSGAIAPGAGLGEEMRQLPKKHSFGGVGMISPQRCDIISTGLQRIASRSQGQAERPFEKASPSWTPSNRGAFPGLEAGSVVQEEPAASAPVSDRALRRVAAWNPCRFDALVDLAEAAIPHVTVIGIGAGAENRRPSRKHDLPGLAATLGRCERALLSLNAGSSGHEGKNKSYHSHGVTRDLNAGGAGRLPERENNAATGRFVTGLTPR